MTGSQAEAKDFQATETPSVDSWRAPGTPKVGSPMGADSDAVS